MMTELKSMLHRKLDELQSLQGQVQSIQGEIHALKAGINRIRNLEAMERDYQVLKDENEVNKQLVQRWNEFWDDEVRNRQASNGYDNTAASDGFEEPKGNDSESDDIRKFKRACDSESFKRSRDSD